MAAWQYFDCDVMIGTSQVPILDEMPDASALLRQMDRYGIAHALTYARDGVNARGASEAAKSDKKTDKKKETSPAKKTSEKASTTKSPSKD